MPACRRTTSPGRSRPRCPGRQVRVASDDGVHFCGAGRRPAVRGPATARTAPARLPRAGRRDGRGDPRAFARHADARGVGAARRGLRRVAWTSSSIAGGTRLEGEVRASGAKNAALPILAAGLLDRQSGHDPQRSRTARREDDDAAARPHGRLRDRGEGGEVRVDASGLTEAVAPYDLVKTMRASILVLGPLLARHGEARVSLPGGCAIGARPVNLHVAGLEAMGARDRDRGRLHPCKRRAARRRAHRPGHGECHRHREPDDGGDARERAHRHRERRARTGGRRPRGLPLGAMGATSRAPGPTRS